MFDDPVKLALGFGTGLVFGFLLQKGQVAKYRTILGQLLLRDWTVLKIMATAIVVGGAGVYALVGAELASLHVKPFLLGGVLTGAVLFGVGLAALGYCPGTTVAACGEGSRDAVVGVLGMLTGAGIFVFSYPWLQPLIQGLGDLGKLTLPDALSTSPWLLILALALAVALLFWGLHHFERKKLRPTRPGTWRWPFRTNRSLPGTSGQL